MISEIDVAKKCYQIWQKVTKKCYRMEQKFIKKRYQIGAKSAKIAQVDQSENVTAWTYHKLTMDKKVLPDWAKSHQNDKKSPKWQKFAKNGKNLTKWQKIVKVAKSNQSGSKGF